MHFSATSLFVDAFNNTGTFTANICLLTVRHADELYFTLTQFSEKLSICHGVSRSTGIYNPRLDDTGIQSFLYGQRKRYSLFLAGSLVLKFRLSCRITSKLSTFLLLVSSLFTVMADNRFLLLVVVANSQYRT